VVVVVVVVQELAQWVSKPVLPRLPLRVLRQGGLPLLQLGLALARAWVLLLQLPPPHPPPSPPFHSSNSRYSQMLLPFERQ